MYLKEPIEPGTDLRTRGVLKSGAVSLPPGTVITALRKQADGKVFFRAGGVLCHCYANELDRITPLEELARVNLE
jgi:hypothetical protein